MVYEKFIQIGGVVFVPELKKPMAIVNVIDLSRLLLDDGSCNRKTVNVKNIKLTDLSIKICHGARPGTVKKVSVNLLTTADPEHIIHATFITGFISP